ncbi:olfactory receptor 2AE1-like [Arvicola amphibius]|uniref:olfactory receptor 2AE1-like n=1 Tax=Arvicola amphibius TaxID=1047088 RepID=UPI001C09FD4D|nr:olfactory receptor 2AE1-like [Arvicola amphibius]
MWKWNQTILEDFILQGLFDDSFNHLCLFLLIMLVFLTAVSGNSLTILLICADPRLHTLVYFLLSQLSLMDLMHVSTTIPKMATNYLSGKKSISFLGCATQHFVYLSLGGAECVLLALMSYDHYVVICHPLCYTVLMSRRVGMMMAVMSWLSASVNSLIHTSQLLSTNGTQFIILVRHDGGSCHGLEQQDPESADYSLSAARKEIGLCAELGISPYQLTAPTNLVLLTRSYF